AASAAAASAAAASAAAGTPATPIASGATGDLGTTAGAPHAEKSAAGGNSLESGAAVAASNTAGARDAPAAVAAAHMAAGSASAADFLAGADNGKHAHAGSDAAALGGNSAEAAAALSQLGSNSSLSAPADAAPVPTLRVQASVDGSDFPQGLTERVSWMVGNGVNGAKLQVNPPQLGPIELRISVQAGHAQVWMTTHSAVTRDALESSTPRLREMLGAQGFGQVSVDISQRSFQDRSTYTPPYQRASGDRITAAAPAVSTIAGTVPRTRLSALDAYA
ncbi:MAG: flagellar hook-length control protein FliK, partial [Pseudomonadota bacterium]|nr:flagellar hook-length control protein FliK [Pseudomonadota bacterium]